MCRMDAVEILDDVEDAEVVLLHFLVTPIIVEGKG